MKRRREMCSTTERVCTSANAHASRSHRKRATDTRGNRGKSGQSASTGHVNKSRVAAQPDVSMLIESNLSLVRMGKASNDFILWRIGATSICSLQTRKLTNCMHNERCTVHTRTGAETKSSAAEYLCVDQTFAICVPFH